MSCPTKADAAKWPQPSPNFVPKQTYQVSFDKLWSAALDALDNNRITTVSLDKATGIIQTDFIQGFSFHIDLILSKGGNDTRYKYNLKLKEQTDGSFKLNIVCKIEESSYTENGGTGWAEVGSRPIHKQLETWLYEQIEKGLNSALTSAKHRRRSFR